MKLEAGDWLLELEPEVGASITALRWRGHDVLRPAPRRIDDPLLASSFPLLPYANRIAEGAFTFQGRAHVLPATPGFAPHTLHGLGWRRPWRVEHLDDRRVDLALSCDAGDEWLWKWSAHHQLCLTESGLAMSLSLTNEDSRPMPAGLGLHPYLALEPTSRLVMKAPQVWLTDERDIPERLADASELMDWSQGAVVAEAPFVDHAYAGWDGQASLLHDGWRVDMRAEAPASWVQIYAPDGQGYVCIEPVTHRPDAHNAPEHEVSGLAELPPGGRQNLFCTITASES